MGVNITEHLTNMQALKVQIKNTRKGYHRNDLLRQYNRMAKELKSVQAYLNKENRNIMTGEKNGKQ